MRTKTQFSNRILSLVLAVVMVVSMLPMNVLTVFAEDTATSAPYSGTMADSFTAGAGTKASPYEIDTAEELYYFASLVTGGETDIHAKLTANIVVNEKVLDSKGELNGTPAYTWTPIGNDYYTNKYTGTFNGASYTISGLYFSESSTNYVGLFGCVGSGGTVQNVGVIDSFLYGGEYVGGVVGCNLGTVENCYNKCTVSGDTEVGGVVGLSDGGGIVENCSNTGTVSGSMKVGGVVGSNKGTVTNCSNTGAVSGDEFVGGVVGLSDGGGIVENCSNTGAVSGSESVGGVVGQFGYGKVMYCSNTGTVSSESYEVGGVVGRSYGTVENCSNTGNVSGKNIRVGGVVGFIAAGTVTNCYNTGSVSGSSYNVGGVVGRNNSGTVTNCYYLTDCAKDGNDTIQYGIGASSEGSTTEDTASSTIAKAADQFASGEVTYLLQSGVAAEEDETVPQVWKQNIDLEGVTPDDAPNFTGGIVYQVTNCENETAYSNTNAPGGHKWKDGVCTVCSAECGHKTYTDSVCDICGTRCNHTDNTDTEYTNDLNGSTHSLLCSVCSGAVEEPTEHTGKVTYTPTEDGTQHTVGYTCCNGSVSEEHTMSSTNGKCVCGHEMAEAKVTSGSVDTYFETLASALGAAQSGDTVTLCSDVDLGTTHHTIPAGVTFRGGEYTVTRSDAGWVYNNGIIENGKFAFAVCNEETGTVNGGKFTYLFRNFGTVNGGNFVDIVCEPGSTLSGNIRIEYRLNYWGECTIDLSNAVLCEAEYGDGAELVNLTEQDLSISSLHLPDNYAVEYNGAVVSVLPAYEYGHFVHACETKNNDTHHWTECACGKTTEEAEHNFNYANNGDTHTATCSVCAYSESETHTEKTAATCVAKAVCSVCGEYGELAKDNHTGTLGTPVPTADGTQHTATYSCCGATVTEDHSFTDGSTCVCGAECDHKTYTNGFCAACGTYQPCAGAGTEDSPYLITNAGNLYWFAQQVNSVKTDFHGKLTADIVVNKDVLDDDGNLNSGNFRTWTPIGSNSNQYTGTFDGAEHTISGLYCDYSSTSYVGLFGYVGSGTVQNVGVVDSYFCGKGSVGGVVGFNYYGTVTNCYNTGAVSGSEFDVGGVVGSSYGTVTNCYNTGAVNGSGSDVGGVVGFNYDTSSVENCYNTGAVNGSYFVGGVVGYNYYGIVENCYNEGTVSGSLCVGGVVGYNEGTVTNCYYLSDSDDGNGGKTAEQFASGAVAWLLNGSDSDGVWKQTLPDDTAPNFTGEQVYYGYADCHSTEMTYNNSAVSSTTINDHNYENGICANTLVDGTTCGDYESATLNDNVYEIGNAGQLMWFAAVVNSGYGDVAQNASANAILTDDIDLNGIVWVAMGRTSATAYTGTFNGQGHTISNLSRNTGTNEGARESFMYYLGAGGCIKNVIFDNADVFTQGHAGANASAVVVLRNSGTISGCIVSNSSIQLGNYAYLAGIAGVNESGGVIENCGVINTSLTRRFSHSHARAAIVHTNNGTVKNCFAYGCSYNNDNAANGGIISAGTAPVNCYYYTTATVATTYGTAMTAEQFASGEVAWLLNGQKADGVWKQTLGENGDATPSFTGAAVYQVSISYCDDSTETNYSNTGEQPVLHSACGADGKCTFCGETLVEISIDKVTLKPGVAGIYFKGAFSINESVAAERYGIAVSVNSNLPVADDSDEASLWTEGANSALISNILNSEKTNAENAANGKMVIYARAYVLLADGTYIYGDVVEVTLQQVVMAIDAQWNNLTAAQQEAIRDMYNTFQQVMSVWNIPNIKAQ